MRYFFGLAPNGLAPKRSRSSVGELLVRVGVHLLQIEPVLLEVAGHVFPCEAADVHEVQDFAGHRLVHSKDVHRVHKLLVHLHRPDDTRFFGCAAFLTCLTFFPLFLARFGRQLRALGR